MSPELQEEELEEAGVTDRALTLDTPLQIAGGAFLRIMFGEVAAAGGRRLWGGGGELHLSRCLMP